MPHKATAVRYPPPLSLRDLADAVTVPTLRTIVMRLPGAVAIGPKKNELWRFAIGDAVIIGYASSVVVAGTNAAQMRELAARIRQAAELTPDQEYAAQEAAESALRFITEQIAHRWRGDVDNECIADLLAQWSTLEPLVEAIAYKELARHCSDIPTQKWYCNTVQTLVRAYTLGIDAGLDVRDAEQPSGHEPYVHTAA